MKSTKKEKKQYKKAFQEAMARELREHKSSFIVFSILRILVLVVLVRQIMLANYEGAFFCILTLLLLYVPSWIQVKLRIELPARPWRSPFSASSLRQKFWVRSTPFMS